MARQGKIIGQGGRNAYFGVYTRLRVIYNA